MKSVDVSIAICTKNPDNRLLEVIEAIKGQELLHVTVELIIVDNGSDNAASQRILSNVLKTWKDIRIIEEPTPGLAFARRRACIASLGSYILFVDDDNILKSDYVKVGYLYMQRNPAVGVLGGQSTCRLRSKFTAVSEAEWNMLAVGKQSPSGVASNDYVWGAGMVVRKEAFSRVLSQGDPICIGRTNDFIETGDDGELCLMIAMLGYEIHVNNALVLEHQIESKRLDSDNLRALRREYKWQINFRILLFMFSLLKLHNIKWKYCVYLIMRPAIVGKVLLRFRRLVKLGYDKY